MISAWAPRVDGYFIKDLPEVLLERGDYHKNVTVMTGYVPQELSEDLGTVQQELSEYLVSDILKIFSCTVAKLKT